MPRALLVECDGETIDQVEDVLDSISHCCVTARTLSRARKYLDTDSYDYVLLGISVPARSTRGPRRVHNAANFLEELHARCNGRTPPVIVLTNLQGGDVRETAEYMRAWVRLAENGAADLVESPTVNSGKPLDRVIKKVIRDKRASRPAPKRPAAAPVDHGDEGEDDARDLAADRDEGAGENENGRIALTEGQRDVLQAMAEKPNTVMHQADLAAAAGYSRSAVWRHIRKLERHGLVARHGDNSRGVVLTAEGEELAKAEAM